MKFILKDVKEDFYAFSTKTSDIARQLALAGIAIIWIFKTTKENSITLDKDLIEILKLLVVCLALDFCHAFVPSIVYGIMNTYHRMIKKKEDDDEISFSFFWNLPEWLFFLGKIFFLLWAYKELWDYLQNKLLT
jgi:hypothetical protein